MGCADHISSSCMLHVYTWHTFFSLIETMLMKMHCEIPLIYRTHSQCYRGWKTFQQSFSIFHVAGLNDDPIEMKLD